MTQYRKEVDLLGEREVPADAYYVWLNCLNYRKFD